MIDVAYQIITGVVALISLFISIAVAVSNRKQLYVEFSKKCEVVDDESVVSLSKTEGGVSPQQYKRRVLLTTFEVVNPSPKDIAYFELLSFENDRGKWKRVELLTERTIVNAVGDRKVWKIDNKGQENETLGELIVPKKITVYLKVAHLQNLIL